MAEKISYEIDPHNRLIARKKARASGVRGFREVLDCMFSVGNGNSLAYHVKKSSNSGIPQQIMFFGNYSLDNGNNLVFTLNKWNNQVEGNRLIIKSRLLDAKDNELVFSAATRDSSGKGSAYILKLGGAWQADKRNRLTFNAERESGAADNLILEGAWEINSNNEIIYSRTRHIKAKGRIDITDALIFKGYWDIDKKNRVSYVLNKQLNSRFDFEVGFIRPVKEGMEYQIAIGIAPKTKRLTLCGQWRLNERLGLLFEMPCQGRQIQSISFGAACKLGENNAVNFKLKNIRDENLDIDLKLSRKALKGQGEAFVQALKDAKEISLTAGIGFKW